MTVSIHATPGRALVISPHQSTTLPAQPAGRVEADAGEALGRWGGGESDSFPSPTSVALTPSLPAHLCLPLPLRKTVPFPLVLLLLLLLLLLQPSTPSTHGLVRPAPSQPCLIRVPIPAAPFTASAPVRDRRVSLISLSASPSPSSVCTQTRPRR